MAKHRYGSRILISEHGIYTREREEELIKAKWVQGIYKNIWSEQFRKMSKLAYTEGSLVTSLFEHARKLQIEVDCPEEKTMVTPNGIRVQNLQILYPDPIWCDHRLFFRAVHFDLQLSCMLEKTCDQTALRVCQL